VKKQFTFITLIVIALIGIWSVLEAPDEAPVVIKNPHFVDAYARDFTMLSMNEDGHPYYTLTAEFMEHFNDSGESEITQPVFNINKDDSAWVISASKGTIDDDNTWVTLSKDVVMLQNNTEAPLQLKTSRMRFNTKTQIAHSNRRVDITQGALSLKSNGMVFNNKTGDLELLAGVNGIYVKN
jgi:lipopolysaccharide export system protein LptC